MALLLLTEPRKAVELFSLPVSLSVLESLAVGLLSKWVRFEHFTSECVYSLSI